MVPCHGVGSKIHWPIHFQFCGEGAARKWWISGLKRNICILCRHNEWLKKSFVLLPQDFFDEHAELAIIGTISCSPIESSQRLRCLCVWRDRGPEFRSDVGSPGQSEAFLHNGISILRQNPLTMTSGVITNGFHCRWIDSHLYLICYITLFSFWASNLSSLLAAAESLDSNKVYEY